ncbi:MAG: DUF2147 domain-containing protein [Beijerinckiaceae bacterium]|nr:DUF2147 domain-containing protein [Beijerinckiaceae bacterium]
MSQTFLPCPGRAFAITVALAAMVLTHAPAWAQSPPVTPEGIWLTKDSESIIRIHPCADSPADSTKVQTTPPPPSFCGTVVWLKDPVDAEGKAKIDNLNTDPAKKNKPVIGLDILLGLVSVTDHWTGQAYNPDDGKLYDITLKLKTDKVPNDELDLRGCILKILCQTQTFTRATEVPGGDPTLLIAGKPTKAHAVKKDSALK